jgi:choline transport protein
VANHLQGEEVINAPVNIPRAMVFGVILGGFMSFGLVITVLFAMHDAESTLNTNLNFPFIQVVYDVTKSKSVTTGLITLLILTALCAGFGNLASVSRLVWAFARDGGLPFSRFFALVSISDGRIQAFPIEI